MGTSKIKLVTAHSFKTYSAKILLFGEHLINLGSDALSIPYDKFSGKLSRTDNAESRLRPFLEYLKSAQFDFLDNQKLAKESFLEFSSDIPEGYGCGSSGAIVAACYTHFRIDNFEEPELLKDRFSKMEAFYHGKSSGTDPLISYYNCPIKFSANSRIEILPDHTTTLNQYSLILIDSGQAREGKTYIKWFMERSEDKIFRSILTDLLIPATQNSIKAYLNNNESELVNHYAVISKIQLEQMDKMIPQNIKTLWVAGLKSEKLYLKICGAGGGGFFLGLQKNNSEPKTLKNYKTYSLA